MSGNILISVQRAAKPTQVAKINRVFHYFLYEYRIVFDERVVRPSSLNSHGTGLPIIRS